VTYDIIIIGAGITGLATALKIKEKKPGLSILILEKEEDVAMHQTGNNSGVIHSGIYYKPGSLKANNCLQGYNHLLSFCRENQIKFELCGKIIVATEEKEIPRLNDLYERGLQNGLDKIRKIGPEEIKNYEPHVNGIAGIHVPYTGIVDYKDVCLKIKELLVKKYQTNFIFNSKVTSIEKGKSGTQVLTKSRSFETKLMINTAGLFSDRIARMSGMKINIRIIPFRGEYYELRKEKQSLVKNLVYPVPDPNFPFLGVHFTRMIKGGVEAGPNAVFSFKREGYKKTDFSLRDTSQSLFWPGFQKVMFKYTAMGLGEFYRSFSKSAFTKALQRLLPEIQNNDLIPGGSGVRAQACDRNGKLIDDFLFAEDREIINVLNAPSPAATASLSIGESIAEIALMHL
jgi:(S)-2-hydroxyglutarate dehydrogenase